jgi:protein-S-isoprenylcysteine O-methyltransferase Ste14
MGKSKRLFIKYKTPLKLEKSTFLIKEGVFSKTRNPMYVGMTTLILGLSVFSTNIIALFVPLAFFLLVSHLYIKKEEILMKDSFRDEYLNYKKSVRRWV